MSFLSTFLKQHYSSKENLKNQQFLHGDSRVMLDEPVIGTFEVLEGYPARIKCNGTTWRFKLVGAESEIAPVDGQEALVIGRQGNCLLIQAH